MISTLLAALVGLLVGRLLKVVIDELPSILLDTWRQEAFELLGQQYVPQVFRAPYRPLSYSIGINRLPVVEMLCAGLTATVIAKLGWTMEGISLLALTWGLLVLAFIDGKHRLLPDLIVLPLLWLGLIVNHYWVFTRIDDAVWGAVAGYLSLWSVYWAFKVVTGREGMAHGDIKLLAMLGAWGGWQILLLVILLSSFAGAVIGSISLRLRPSQDPAIAFGPYLAIAGFVSMLWGDQIISAYKMLGLH